MTHTITSAYESVDGRRMARAARIIAPGRIELVPQLRPRPGPGEVVLRIEGCRVCASNLAPWAGPAWMNFPTEPGALGHEAWGVIEAVGAQWPLDLAAELTAERGRLVVSGYHQDGPRHVNMQLWNWRGLDVINAHERDRSN